MTLKEIVQSVCICIAFCLSCVILFNEFNITRIGMVFMPKRQQPHRGENVRPGLPIGLHLKRGNPHITGHAGTGPKTSRTTTNLLRIKVAFELASPLSVDV